MHKSNILLACSCVTTVDMKFETLPNTDLQFLVIIDNLIKSPDIENPPGGSMLMEIL